MRQKCFFSVLCRALGEAWTEVGERESLVKRGKKKRDKIMKRAK